MSVAAFGSCRSMTGTNSVKRWWSGEESQVWESGNVSTELKSSGMIWERFRVEVEVELMT